MNVVGWGLVGGGKIIDAGGRDRLSYLSLSGLLSTFRQDEGTRDLGLEKILFV